MNNFDYQSFLNGTNNFNGMLPQDNSYNNNQSINSNLYGPYEGFIKGNLFNNLYDPYKNYTPTRLVPKSEQEEALLNIDQVQFAMHELNLYLDNYPNDIGVLLTRNVPSLSITPVSYNDVTLFRFYKTTPVAEVITPKEIQKLSKSINKLGYQIISDCFIYQVAENHTEEENDFICVEFIVKHN